jgi:hypothetical protein
MKRCGFNAQNGKISYINNQKPEQVIRSKIIIFDFYGFYEKR